MSAKRKSNASEKLSEIEEADTLSKVGDSGKSESDGVSIQEDILSAVDNALNTESGSVSFSQDDFEYIETIQYVPAFSEDVSSRIDDIFLCLVVLLFAFGVFCGLVFGSILWERIER